MYSRSECFIHFCVSMDILFMVVFGGAGAKKNLLLQILKLWWYVLS